MTATKEQLPSLSVIETQAFSAWVGTCEENNVLPFRSVAEYSMLPKEKVRRAVRSLARKGYVELTTGFNDEGLICGKGYMPTVAGHHALISQSEEKGE